MAQAPDPDQDDPRWEKVRAELEANLVAKYGQEWVDQSRRRLDAEFEFIKDTVTPDFFDRPKAR